MKIIFLSIILILTASNLGFSENIFYVDSQNGNDNNDGLSPASAWRTIGKVNDSWDIIQSGDDILLKRGEVYTDSCLNIRKGGTSSNPMIIGAYGSGVKPIIDGGPNSINSGINCSTPDLSFIIIQDLIIKNIKMGQGIGLGADNLSHITIAGIEIDNNTYNNGILLRKISTYLIENCLISNCANSGIAIIGSPTYPITNGVICNNIVHDIKSNDGITLHRDGNGYNIGPAHQVLNNILYNCAEEGLDITSGDSITLRKNETFNNSNGGIVVGHEASNVWIDKHYSHDEKKVGINIGTSSHVKLTSSIIYNSLYQLLTVGNCVGFECLNNTLICGPNSTRPMLDIAEKPQNLFFYNNIFASIKTGFPDRIMRYLSGATPGNTNSSFDYNVYWVRNPSDDRMWWDGANLYNFNGWKSFCKQDSHSLFADPRFVDPTNRNFHLQSSSPCIDAGIDIGLRSDFDGTMIPQGKQPDIGAYENIKTEVLSASATASPNSGQAPLTVSFTANSSGGVPPYSYAWNFGDGQSSTSQNPTHTYSNAGNYAAVLTVTDSKGSTDEVSLSISVVKPGSETYELTISSTTGAPAPGQGGTTDPPPGNYTYSAGSSVQIQSIANEYYRLSKWTGDVGSSSVYQAMINVLIDRAISAVANFCTACGDVTGDLIISPADAQKAFDLYLENIQNPSWCELENADVNSSGTTEEPQITPADAQAIFNRYLYKGELPSDCSGASRETATASLSFQSIEPGEIYLTINSHMESQNRDLYVPVIIDSSSEISAFGFDLLFSSEDLVFIGVERSDLTEGFYQVGAHEKAAGSIRIGGYASQLVSVGGPAVLVILIFRVTGRNRGLSSFSITNTYDDLKNAQIGTGLANLGTDREARSSGTKKKAEKKRKNGIK